MTGRRDFVTLRCRVETAWTAQEKGSRNPHEEDQIHEARESAPGMLHVDRQAVGRYSESVGFYGKTGGFR